MTQQAKARERSNSIQSVQRAAAILKAFDGESPQLGVSEVGRRLKLHKSTVSRLLATLESEGLVERVPHSDKYRLGYEVVRLAGQVRHFGDVRSIARGVLSELADASGETVNLAMLDGREVVNVDQVSSPHIVGISNWIGRRTPLHCVANGKALLAFMPRAKADAIVRSPLLRYTPHTLTSKTALRAELARIRARGYATAVSEIEEGLNAVAAPIFDARGQVVAALSVSGPAYRISRERMQSLGALTVQAADTISARLRALAGKGA